MPKPRKNTPPFIQEENAQSIIRELVTTLEFCVACEGKLTWETEQEADALCRRVRQTFFMK